MPDGRSSDRRAPAVGLTAVVLVLAVVSATHAGADPVGPPTEQAYPSEQQVDAARRAVDGTSAQIEQVESRLSDASAELDRTTRAAAMATEDYNQARSALEVRQAAARRAKAAARNARGQAAAASDEIGRLAASSYRDGTRLGGLEVFLAAGGPEDVLDRAAALDQLGKQRQRVYQRADATRAVAKVLDEQAAKAQAAQTAAARAAAAAREAAAAAQSTAQAEVERVAATRSQLVAQLAALRQTGVGLEQQRQAGLEAERQARQEAAARQAAAEREAVAAREAAAARQAEAERQAQRAPADERAAEQRAADRASRDRPAPVARPVPPPAGSAGSPASGQAAVAWARTQIGKPYLWGASGPSAYDCSGLTLRAWQRAGVLLPRSSRDQYRAVQKVAYSQLRPGDLVFYGEGGNASSIYHVAVYSGDDRMIEAPSAGKPVREVPLRRSGSTDFAGRP
ncbi:MAG: C40 family peptidase [Actinomycetes bacterium]